MKSRKYLFILPLLLLKFLTFSQNDAKKLVTEISQGLKELEMMSKPPMSASKESMVTSMKGTIEKKIADLKKADPSYNTQEFESRLSQLGQTSSAPAKPTKGSKEKITQLNLYLIKNLRKTQVPEEMEANRKKLTEFESEFKSYINNEVLVDPDMKNVLPQIEKQWKESGDADKTNNYKKYAKQENKDVVAMNEFLIMKFVKTKWTILAQAYPNSTVIKNAMSEIESAINEVGGEEGVKSIVKANRLEKAKTVKMQAAEGSDPTTEAQLKAALSEFYNTKGKPILKIHLLSKDWTVEKNAITGAIIHRYKPFQIAYKDTDGFCRLFTDRIQQDYTGSGYGKGYIVNGPYMGGYADIMCENVK